LRDAGEYIAALPAKDPLELARSARIADGRVSDYYLLVPWRPDATLVLQPSSVFRKEDSARMTTGQQAFGY
jgi:hypothetical protein